jgi:hypothetical protein
MDLHNLNATQRRDEPESYDEKLQPQVVGFIQCSVVRELREDSPLQ